MLEEERTLAKQIAGLVGSVSDMERMGVPQEMRDKLRQAVKKL